MLFSVVIPCFNRRALLPLALASVSAQTFTDYEVIIVDDGSTDATAEYLATVPPSIRVIRQPNLGPGAARNAGVAAATGDYLAFLDSDDLWFPWTLASLATIIRATASPALVGGRVIQFGEADDVATVKDEPVQSISFDDFLASTHRAVLIGSGTVAIRRDLMAASGGFTPRQINAEDIDLILKLGTAPGFVLVTAPVTVAWRRHEYGVTQDMKKSLDGVRLLLEHERTGRYPGGPGRARQRRRVITRHARPLAMACLRSDAIPVGVDLYFDTFSWHVQLGRWAFLLAFPLAAAWAVARPLRRIRN